MVKVRLLVFQLKSTAERTTEQSADSIAMTVFNQFGFFQHAGYTFVAGQFIDDPNREINTWTSPIQFFPADGTGDHEGCYASAKKTSEAFAKVAEATGVVSIDGGVRNCILEGAVEGLLGRYGTNRKRLLAEWRYQKIECSVFDPASNQNDEDAVVATEGKHFPADLIEAGSFSFTVQTKDGRQFRFEKDGDEPLVGNFYNGILLPSTTPVPA